MLNLLFKDTINNFSKRRNICLKNLWILYYLARNLLSIYCANILEKLKNILLSENFISKHRQSPNDFTRNRKLPFQTLFCILINFLKSSYQTEIDIFFQSLDSTDLAKRVVTKSAFFQARKKLKFEAFIDLNRQLIQLFKETFRLQNWYGFRLLAIDGSTLKLPSFQEIIDHFGVQLGAAGVACPMARISQIFDVGNKLTTSAVITPLHMDERKHAQQLFADLLPTDLLLMDRGYPAFWLFKLLGNIGVNFCARIPIQWKCVKNFVQSGFYEQIIDLPASAPSARQCKKMGLDTVPLRLRLVRVELDSGEIEVLITTLTDTVRFPLEIFADLYHQRWPVEEDYKTLKCRMEIERFTGESVLSIYQDFHAAIFAKNLTSVLCYSPSQALKRACKTTKYEHQINFAHALAKMKNTIALLFQRSHIEISRILENLYQIFIRTTEPIRPGRKYPRNQRILRRSFYMTYKLVP